MTSQILFDLVLTVAGSFSLIGLLAVATMALPWREEELDEVERALLTPLHRLDEPGSAAAVAEDPAGRRAA